jgi:hypothetical protein
MFNIFKAAVNHAVISALENKNGSKTDVVPRADAIRYLAALKWAALSYNSKGDGEDWNEYDDDESLSIGIDFESTIPYVSISDPTGQTTTRIIVQCAPDSNGVLHIACRGTAR